jgi:hypothetical protein
LAASSARAFWLASSEAAFPDSPAHEQHMNNVGAAPLALDTAGSHSYDSINSIKCVSGRGVGT